MAHLHEKQTYSTEINHEAERELNLEDVSRVLDMRYGDAPNETRATDETTGR